MNRLRFWLIRLLGVKQCGMFGGYEQPYGVDRQRWCVKPFGHADSCRYESFPDRQISQPGFLLRMAAKGHNVSRDEVQIGTKIYKAPTR